MKEQLRGQIDEIYYEYPYPLPMPEHYLNDDEVIRFGNHALRTIHTPGHTKGGICLFDGENLITGDTIFAGGGVGRMDIGGDYGDMKNSVEKLLKLDVENIYPGHGPVVEGDGRQHIKLSYSLL